MCSALTTPEKQSDARNSQKLWRVQRASCGGWHCSFRPVALLHAWRISPNSANLCKSAKTSVDEFFLCHFGQGVVLPDTHSGISENPAKWSYSFQPSRHEPFLISRVPRRLTAVLGIVRRIQESTHLAKLDKNHTPNSEYPP